jgi:hypothetical protein
VKEHPNFYENLKEAHIRLRGTVVLYDGEPMYVSAITDHKKDGIFRMYMYPIGTTYSDGVKAWNQLTAQYPSDHPALGELMDAAMKGQEGLLRKHMNSPLFNRFKPFPLGMCNIKGKGTSFVERQPNRHTPQGLTASMLYDVEITPAGKPGAAMLGRVQLHSDDFRNCVLGKYPTPQECLAALSDHSISNEAAAFRRQFAFARGPIDMIFLAYKEDIVGLLPKGDFSEVKLGRQFSHVKEVVNELELFDSITMCA